VEEILANSYSSRDLAADSPNALGGAPASLEDIATVLSERLGRDDMPPPESHETAVSHRYDDIESLRDLASGALVELLSDTPPPSAPVAILYPRSRQLSPRVRVFLDWASQQFAKRGSASRQ